MKKCFTVSSGKSKIRLQKRLNVLLFIILWVGLIWLFDAKVDADKLAELPFFAWLDQLHILLKILVWSVYGFAMIIILAMVGTITEFFSTLFVDKCVGIKPKLY